MKQYFYWIMWQNSCWFHPKKSCSFCYTVGNWVGWIAHKNSLSHNLGLNMLDPCLWTDDIILRSIQSFLQYKPILFIVCPTTLYLKFKLGTEKFVIYHMAFTLFLNLISVKCMKKTLENDSFFLVISSLKASWRLFMFLKYLKISF